MTIDKDKVRLGIKNAVKPSYDNGEWALWCGEKEWAEAVLEAARAWLDGQDKDMVLVPRSPTQETLDAMNEQYMPFGEMAAAYDAMIAAAKKEKKDE